MSFDKKVYCKYSAFTLLKRLIRLKRCIYMIFQSTSNTTERRVNSNENLDLANKNFALLNGISQSKSALSVFSQLSLASAQLSEVYAAVGDSNRIF